MLYFPKILLLVSISFVLQCYLTFSDIYLSYSCLGRGKRSIAVNLKNPEGVKIVRQLCSKVFMGDCVSGGIDKGNLDDVSKYLHHNFFRSIQLYLDHTR